MNISSFFKWYIKKQINMDENNIDDEWSTYLSMSSKTTFSNKKPVIIDDYKSTMDIPMCEELNISTTTKVLFLNQPVDIGDIFWKIPIIEYSEPKQGVIKKQMKIVSHSQEEYLEYTKKLENLNYYTEHIIKRLDNPNARRNRFKDERKITIGISKKDIMNCRGKVKNAFYNCFAIIIRFQQEEIFREIHVKIFNTGKMEIPGILNDELLNNVREMISDILRPIISTDIPIGFIENDDNNSVLINSNFNCGFYINREKIYSILRSEKYNIETAYDPCSYPGVKCKFYFNHDSGYSMETQCGYISKLDCKQKMNELGENKRYTEVSFMIFRTGSCLIVGNCSQKILNFIYSFIKNMLSEEYSKIVTLSEVSSSKVKQVKIRKRMVTFTKEYMDINHLFK